MAKLFGIVFIVAMIWVGVEVFTKGVGGAFGGVFASASDTEAADERSTPQRAADAFQRAYDKSEERVNRQLDPESY